MVFRRIFLSFFLGLLLFSVFPISASAQLGILPVSKAEWTADNCKTKIGALQGKSDVERAATSEINFILGCSIKYGLVRLWMLPFFITELVQFLVALAGMVCMLYIVVGGYQYISGGLTDDKEKGKKTVMYAIAGFVVVLVSWIVINIIQTQLTK